MRTFFQIIRVATVILLSQVASGQEATPTAAPTPTPMPAAQQGVHIYGWVQQGFTANFDSPRDRTNFGVNFNWRSNDYRLNQVYFVIEKSLEHEATPDVGYRVDFVIGHDAPFLAANGLFSNFTGFDPSSGFGVNGPASFRNVNRIGIDLPQFYFEVHIPNLDRKSTRLNSSHGSISYAVFCWKKKKTHGSVHVIRDLEMQYETRAESQKSR